MAGCKSSFFLLAVLAVTAPLGKFMTRVFAREKTWLDPVLRPIERLIYRADRRERRRARCDGPSTPCRILMFSVVSMLVLYVMQRAAARAAVQPAGIRAGGAGPRLQHGGVVHHQHELAGLRRRDDHELLHADGRPRVPQLRVGGGRYLGGDRLHPRHRPAGEGDARQLLGRPGPGLALRPAADRHRRLAVPGVPRRRAEPQAVRQGRGSRSADGDDHRRRRQAADHSGRGADDRPGPGGVAGDHQAVRHQRRRLLQRQQRAPVREPDAALQLSRDARHLRDFVRPHLHARIDDRIAEARMGGLGGDGVPVRRRRHGRVSGPRRAATRCWPRPGRIRWCPRPRPAATWRARKCGSALPTPPSSPR